MADTQGAAVSFDLRELDGVKKLLEDITLKSDDRHQLLTEIGVEMVTQTENRFYAKDKVAPSGEPWAAIATATKKYYNSVAGRKRLDGTPRPPLLISEFLVRSLTQEVQGGDWSVLVGATAEYAAVHQFGWRAKNIPARPYLGVSSEDAKEIEGIVRDFLARSFK